MSRRAPLPLICENRARQSCDEPGTLQIGGRVNELVAFRVVPVLHRGHPCLLKLSKVDHSLLLGAQGAALLVTR